MIDDFRGYFVPGGEVLYIGDADEKLMHFDEDKLASLGVTVDTHGKLPDLIVYQEEKNWLFLMEAASTQGPVGAKRHGEVQARCSPDRRPARSTCPASLIGRRCASSSPISPRRPKRGALRAQRT